MWLRPRRNPFIVANGPECQIWKQSFKTLTVLNWLCFAEHHLNNAWFESRCSCNRWICKSALCKQSVCKIKRKWQDLVFIQPALTQSKHIRAYTSQPEAMFSALNYFYSMHIRVTKSQSSTIVQLYSAAFYLRAAQSWPASDGAVPALAGGRRPRGDPTRTFRSRKPHTHA